MLELCFPLFLCYLKKPQGFSLAMYVKYLSPELQQHVPALPQSSLFSSPQAHVDASPLVSQEEREWEHFPASQCSHFSSSSYLLLPAFPPTLYLFQVPSHGCLCPRYGLHSEVKEQWRRCCSHLVWGFFLLPTRRDQAVPQHSYEEEAGIIPPSPDLPASQYRALLKFCQILWNQQMKGNVSARKFWVCMITKE